MTAHELARQLLAGPDLPIYHFDPSMAGQDEERDTSLSTPTVEFNEAEVFEHPDTGKPTNGGAFLTISSDDEELIKSEADDSAALHREVTELGDQLKLASHRAKLLSFLQREGFAMPDDWIEGHLKRVVDRRGA